MKLISLVAAAAITASAAPALALDFGSAVAGTVDSLAGGQVIVGGNVSTLGLGGELGYKVHDRFAVRGVHSGFSFNTESELEGSDFDIDLNMRSTGVMFDVHPFGGGLRLTAGARKNDISADLSTTFRGSFEYQGETYSDSEDTTVTGKIEFPKIAPVAMVGWHGGIGNFSFGADVGAMFTGAPNVDLAASGGVADRNDAAGDTFRAALEKQEADIQDFADALKIYPVAQVGVSFKF
jgi:hypothetical protein